MALRAEGSEYGYPELAQLLRRRGPVDVAPTHMRELFRRMVFNLLIDNTDWKDPPHVHVPKDWPLVHQSRNVMTETSIWRKP